MRHTSLNNLGSMGRIMLKVSVEKNDTILDDPFLLIPISNLAYLFKYETLYGRFNKEALFN